MYAKVQNDLSHRHIDENGYLFVDKSPILKAGILEYLGSEILDEGKTTVDGVQIDKDKIYKIYLPEEELFKSKSSFELLPLVDEHTWLGVEGSDAKDHQEGTTGENAFVEDGLLFLPLKFTGDKIIEDINNNKVELSASYVNKLTRSEDPSYDFVASDLKGNHVALVERGRCGSAVRVFNMEKNKMKTKNDVKLLIDGKEIDLAQFFAQEAQEDAHKGTQAITENEDKREIIREIMAVAGKSNEEFEGGEDEKVREIAKLAEQLAYNPSEKSQSDNEEPDKKTDNEEPDCEKEKEEEEKMYNSMYSKISNALSEKFKKEEESKIRAYNAARDVCGDFNYCGMSEKDIYTKALNHYGIEVKTESIAEMAAMLKACKSTCRVDNSFDYNSQNGDLSEVDVNF